MLRFTNKAASEDEVKVAASRLSLSINELTWLKLEQIGVLNDVLKSVHRNTRKEWMVQSDLM